MNLPASVGQPKGRVPSSLRALFRHLRTIAFVEIIHAIDLGEIQILVPRAFFQFPRRFDMVRLEGLD